MGDEPQDLPAGTRVGEYVLEGRVARGGMSSVYAAVHPLLGKRAAVKVLDVREPLEGAHGQRLLSEARTVNLIHHPNVVEVFACGQLPDGRSYLVMDFLAGESLALRLRRFRLAHAEAYEILIQVADVLDAAHGLDIAHLDLKPDNIFLVPVNGGRTLVKVLDFGLAAMVDPQAAPSQVPSGFRGTPDYASPEQAQGQSADQRSDVYSLGVVAYETLVGQRPFVGATVVETLLKQIGEAPRRPTSLVPTLTNDAEQLLLDMLNKDPAQRPRAGDVRERLLAFRTTILKAATQTMPRVDARR
jgi:serine/threonine protein kinase